MPANHKVSVGWQIVFTFIAILNLWAFYRIRKLRKYLLYVFVPSVIIAGYLSYNGSWFMVTDIRILLAPSTLISMGIQVLAVYLVIIWSRQHNKQFDQPAT